MGSAFVAACLVLAKIVQTDLLGEPLHPLQATQARFLFGFIGLFIFYSAFPIRFTKPDIKLHVIRTLCGFSAVTVMFTAAAIIPVSDATAISFLNPVFAMIFALPLLGEKIGKLRWTSALIGLLGAFVLLRPSASAFEPAALLALIAAVVMGLEFILIKILSTREQVLQILLINNVLGLLFSSISLLFVWTSPTLIQWIALSGIGFLMLGAQVCNLIALRGADASLVLPFSFTTLIFVTGYDFMVFAVTPDLISWVGAIIIIFGVSTIILQQISDDKKTIN
jgi:drug/metabolite transporter (DMT)-like permease|tara:strand:- start:611 stop:1453 length:843 start_codon:yes stop_codon:yes gene_type:complete